MEAVIRPLHPDDVPAAADVGWTSIGTLDPEAEDDPDRRRLTELRVAHLLATDPGGSWVAELDGRVVGVALGLIRDGVFGFSLFGMLPDAQGRGIGRRLLAPALAYGAGESGGLIMSSVHPAAMRSYSRAGYALHPAVELNGAWDPRRVPAGLRSRPGDVATDAETLHRASRHVRGASHARDWELLQARFATLLVLPDRGFAFAEPDGSPALLAALDEDAACDLLWSCLLSGPRGGTVAVHPVTAPNDWAVRVGLEAGLALSATGPMFVRGEVGPLAPYLPSGAYL